MLAMVLTSVGLPVDGIALVAGVDRIFDMGRTTVNITGDASCCVVVSNLEKKREARKLTKNKFQAYRNIFEKIQKIIKNSFPISKNICQTPLLEFQFPQVHF